MSVSVGSQDTVGLVALYVGTTFQVFLAGCTTLAFVHYTRSRLYARDGLGTKAIIWTTTICNLVYTAIAAYRAYFYCSIVANGQDVFSGNKWPEGAMGIPQGIIAVCVQGFLIRRSTMMFRNIWVKRVIGGFLGLLAVVSLWACMFKAILDIVLLVDVSPSLAPFNGKNTFQIWQGSSAALDVLITVTLSAGIYPSLKTSSLDLRPATMSVLRKIIHLSVLTASYTAAFAFVGAVTSFTITISNLYFHLPPIFALPLSSLYVISLFVTLYARDSLRTTLFTASRSCNTWSESGPSHERPKSMGKGFQTGPGTGTLEGNGSRDENPPDSVVIQLKTVPPSNECDGKRHADNEEIL